MEKIVLQRKTYQVGELVFKQLRAIGAAYSVLAKASAADADKVAALDSIIIALIGKPLKLSRISAAEWQAFFSTLPKLCGLDDTDKLNKVSASKDNWGRVYAHLSACFGWDYDYIDNHMTLSRLKEYGDYIKDNPPVHQMVAAYLGVNNKAESAGEAYLAAMLHRAKQLNQQRSIQ